MNPVLGNLIVIAAIAALVFVCARFLWNDYRHGGGCAGCGGGCGGNCAGCHHCEKPSGPLPDLSELRIHRDKPEE